MCKIPHCPDSRGLGQLGWAELISACARDRGDTALWSEFLSRYGPRINQFIWRTLCALTGKITAADAAAAAGGMEASDLFQSTIMRLVEHDCAAIRRFSGSSEYEWLAYLAVIARSIVRDSLRRQHALKRPGGAEAIAPPFSVATRPSRDKEGTEHLAMERELLAQEVRNLCIRAINGDAGECSSRDLLVFRLYFDHDLSTNQIAQCRNVNLSKAGVEKVIRRLRNRVRSAVSTDPSEALI
jgi:RNA polymerase sigma factor (sigma-70 family)